MDSLIIHETIGRGQFGGVKRVTHTASQTTMAMKEINLDVLDGKESLSQIMMELQILHQSKSDYIIHFYGAFYQHSTVYYCLEYMDGGSLEKLYQGGVEEHILSQIAHAVRIIQIESKQVIDD